MQIPGVLIVNRLSILVHAVLLFGLLAFKGAGAAIPVGTLTHDGLRQIRPISRSICRSPIIQAAPTAMLLFNVCGRNEESRYRSRNRPCD